MLWRGIVWPSLEVQTLVLWDKGISECELWSKSQIILYVDSGYLGKNRNILSSGAPPVTPHLFPSSEAKLYFIPYSVLGRYINPTPSLCNSASLWNQEVFKRWTDSAANSLTGYQVPTYDVHWLWHCSTLICSVKVNPKLELSPLQSSESGTVGGGGWVKRSELKPGIWEIQTKRDNFTLNQSNFPVGVTVWNSRSCPKWRLLYTNTSTWKNIFKFNWIWIEVYLQGGSSVSLKSSDRQQGGDQFQQQRAFHLAKEG